MRYLLDINVIVQMLNATKRKVVAAVRRHPIDDVVTSSVVIHELFYGAFQSTKQAESLSAIDDLRMPVLDLDKKMLVLLRVSELVYVPRARRSGRTTS